MALVSSPKQTLLLGTRSSTASGTSSFTGVTTGTSQPIAMPAFDEIAIYFESVGTTSGGTLLIEEASRSDYTGTWSTISTVAASSFTGGTQIAYHVSPNIYAFVRVRISSDITGGGTVLVFLNQQGS